MKKAAQRSIMRCVDTCRGANCTHSMIFFLTVRVLLYKFTERRAVREVSLFLLETMLAVDSCHCDAMEYLGLVELYGG